MKIYLIGMPASGKSTIGRALAQKLKYTYVDTDQYIEEKEGMWIPQIFEQKGEAAFRDMETEALNDLMSMDNIIVSCGGGIVLRKENKLLMHGPIVYLAASIEDLELRMNRDTKNVRPVSKKKSVRQLYEERKDLYDEFKDIEVKSNIISHTVRDILKGVSKKYGKIEKGSRN